MSLVGFFKTIVANNSSNKEDKKYKSAIALDKNSSEQSVNEEKEMIEGVEALSSTIAREVMVPRIDTVFLNVEDPLEDILKKATDAGHSRIPVFKDTIDNVIGVLYAKDLLRELVKSKGEGFLIKNLLREAYFIPESKRIDSLLREFRRSRVHIAIVVDEYGGVSGVVCLEDIIEEIVGEIDDEYDEAKIDIKTIDDSTWICDARTSIDTINQELSISLPAENSDSIGGFVFSLFGKIPNTSEKINYNNIEFTVHEMDGHRITVVKLHKFNAREEEKTKDSEEAK